MMTEHRTNGKAAAHGRDVFIDANENSPPDVEQARRIWVPVPYVYQAGGGIGR